MLSYGQNLLHLICYLHCFIPTLKANVIRCHIWSVAIYKSSVPCHFWPNHSSPHKESLLSTNTCPIKCAALLNTSGWPTMSTDFVAHAEGMCYPPCASKRHLGQLCKPNIESNHLSLLALMQEPLSS